MTDTQIYKVKDPSGQIREIRGPVGASDEEIISQAQSIFGGQGITKAPLSDRVAADVKRGFPNGYDVGGAITDWAAKRMSPETAAGLGYLGNVTFDALPMLVGGLIGHVADPIAKTAGKRLMQSAVKPGVEALETGKGDKAITTLLEEGINPTRGGMKTLQSNISDLNTQIKNIVSGSTATVSKGNAAAPVQDVIARYTMQATPAADTAAAEKVLQEFMQHPELAGRATMPIQTAQAIKQGTYRALGDKAYGMGLKPAAERDALKAIAEGLRNEISAAEPTVAPLNAKEGELLNALNVAGRRALIDANKNPGGIAWLADSPAMLAAFLADKSTLLKSLAARLLYSGHVPETLGASVGALAGMESGQPPGQPVLLEQPRGILAR